MTSIITKLSGCRICDGTQILPLLSLGEQSFTGIFPRDAKADVPVGPLELVKCGACDLVQLNHSFDPGLMYGENYGYRSGLNGSMVRHLNHKIHTLVPIAELREGDLVVDIGSNDGTTLRAYPDRNLEFVGFDPTGSKFRAFYPSDVTLVSDFFSEAAFRSCFGSRKAKVVTSFAMFYDLETPVAFMKDVESILDNEGIWVFEQSYLQAMLDTSSYDTICHEHLEYYGLKQICKMADLAGLKVLDVEFNDVNGGSFSIVACKRGSSRLPKQKLIDDILNKEEKSGLYSLSTYRAFGERVAHHKRAVRNFFDWASDARKRVIGYGASTKGNVLLQHCGITARELICIAEVNTDKVGAFTPGSLIPIVSEDAAKMMKPDCFFVLPWHFRQGIMRRESQFIENGGCFAFPLPLLEIAPDEVPSVDDFKAWTRARA